jgi:hypothetical protein
MKIYPDEHPEWARDHILLGVGYTKSELIYNTNWGRQEKRSFAVLSRKVSEGLSFANRYNVYLGYAIKGLRLDSKLAGLKPVRLTITRDKNNKHVDLAAEHGDLPAKMRGVAASAPEVSERRDIAPEGAVRWLEQAAVRGARPTPADSTGVVPG